MGEEIDSLADAVNFGVAPAFIVYATLLSHSRIGWIVVLLYAVCIVLRLARFNALLDVDQPAYEGSTSSGCLPRRARSRDRRWRQDADSWHLVGLCGGGMGGDRLDGRRLAAGRQPHPDAPSRSSVPPNWSLPLLALVAISVAAPRCSATHRDHGDRRGLRDPHSVRGHASTGWPPTPNPGTTAQRLRAARAIRRAQPHRRSVARQASVTGPLRCEPDGGTMPAGCGSALSG